MTGLPQEKRQDQRAGSHRIHERQGDDIGRPHDERNILARRPVVGAEDDPRMLRGPLANGRQKLRLAGIPTGDQQPRIVTWQALKALDQSLQTLVGKETAKKPVGEGSRWHAEGGSGLLARHRCAG